MTRVCLVRRVSFTGSILFVLFCRVVEPSCLVVCLSCPSVCIVCVCLFLSSLVRVPLLCYPALYAYCFSSIGIPQGMGTPLREFFAGRRRQQPVGGVVEVSAQQFTHGAGVVLRCRGEKQACFAVVVVDIVS